MTHRRIEFIVIHESDTPNGRPQTVQDIDQWHKERGFRRGGSAIASFNPALKCIGYHYVIYIDGSLHTGRAEAEVPAAVQGYNSTSINICLIGKGRYSVAQWDTLKDLTAKLLAKYPGAAVMGHCQFDTAKAQQKTCPDFDVPTWVKRGMVADAGNTYGVKV
jgi:N-acetylmuramoyl-L-alanine amidase